MAEHPHAMLVRKGYEAFSRGDMDALRGLMSADATYHVPGNHPLAGDFKGQDAIIGFYERLAQESGGTMDVELRTVLVDGRGHAVAVHRVRAERKGEHFEQMGCYIFRIVGDKITDVDECVEDLDSANAFWG
ncbi:nuclear transport factor 2 family protein [Streptomyces griseoincarnatus]|uniref:nuclear transport factor 2 family protein n=1 Tax=Streptomyces sp. SMS_SU21 TaxID=2069440 RepID=UPI000C87DFE8|nr:nuclear transport factor 2 family protein [Streptomyces sp. SMS_SU21]MCA2203376.1 nuclear transport factor 2 family protein [Streptomyces sp. SMS_SU21]NEA93119.1 nuclear transport factor 2 family protein [Actinospica acidiphila]